MKLIISDQFYPSLMDMNECALILHNGLIENTHQLLSKEKEDNMKLLLREYTQAFKKHKEDVIDGMLKELGSL